MSDRKSPNKPLAELWLKEDWWAIWIAVIFLAGIMTGILQSPVLPAKWGTAEVPSVLGAISADKIGGMVFTGTICLVLFAIAIVVSERDRIKSFIAGFPFIFLLAILAELLGNYSPLRHYGFNNVIWALALGLLISNTVKTPKLFAGAVRTELYIKTGLVLLGASIFFDRLLALGIMGIGVAWTVPPTVILFMYWFSQKYLKMHAQKEFAVTLAAATSVCGVSAAIAAGTAAKAKKEEISLSISISLIFTALMMIGMPAIVKLLGLGPFVGGAWLGGTIDSTGAVVAAGAVLGEEALEVASVVKMVQNLLIGVIAFAIAIFFTVRREGKSMGESHVGAKEIWIRMPKFVLGFILASIVFSFFVPNELADETIAVANNWREFLFTLAFISIGLETNFKDMAKLVQGGKPLTLYLVGQTANLVLTLIAAYVFFSGRWFPLPF